MIRKSNWNVVFFALRNALEHNPAIVYRTVFVGETLDLIARRPGWECRSVDVDVDEVSLTKVISVLSGQPDVVILWADVHHSRLARQVAEIARKVAPDSCVFVFGRATSFIPQYFERSPFDVIHVAGDREATIASLMAHIEDSDFEVSGASVRQGRSGAYRRTAPRRLPPGEWPFPALASMPMAEYGRFAETHHAPGYARRIAVTAAKGCAWNCAYCSATHDEGHADRRRDTGALFDWFSRAGIESYDSLVHLYAPDLFAEEDWIFDFAREYRARRARFGWRGVTTTRTLQNCEVVEAAGANGCRELAVGIEHASRLRATSVKSSLDEIETAARLTRDAGIVLKGLVMLGYPGQTEDDVRFVEEIADSCGLKLRYTGYTPLHRLRHADAATLDSIILESYDRRTFREEKSALSPSFFYRRIVENGGYHLPAPEEQRADALPV